MTNDDSEGARLAQQTTTFIVEQYKAKLADLGNLGLRQTATSASYVAVLTALVGVLAFKDRSLGAVDGAVLVTVCGAGALVSCLWYWSLGFFRSVFKAKLRVLGEMERSMPFQTFEREFLSMKSEGNARWLRIEQLVPAIFGCLYIGLLVVRLVMWFGVDQVLCGKAPLPV